MNPWKVKIGEVEFNTKENEIQKGQTRGTTFWALDLDILPDGQPVKLDTLVKAYGEEFILNEILKNEWRSAGLEITKEAKERSNGGADEQVFTEAFNTMIKDLEANRLTKKALAERVNTLTAELSKIRPVFSANGLPDLENKETVKFFQTASQLQKAQLALEQKKSKDAEPEPQAELAEKIAA